MRASNSATRLRKRLGASRAVLVTPSTYGTDNRSMLADKLSVTLVGGSPEALDKMRRADYIKWGQVIRDAGIKA